MELTRRQLLAGLLVPLVPRRLLASPASPPLPEILSRKYESNTFYRMDADFVGDHPYKLGDRHALMLHLCANALHRKVLEAAKGRRVIWRAPMELHGFIDWEWVGNIGPVPRCRHLAAWDCVEGRWVHRLDVDVAFCIRRPTRYGIDIDFGF